MNPEIARLEGEIARLREELRRAKAPALRPVRGDHAFRTLAGPVTLRELFGSQGDLIVIHNMGRECVYCTTYADGIHGVARHLQSRAALVVLSPDEPLEQHKFAESRGWTFRMISVAGTDNAFNQELGFASPGELVNPGFSTFHRDPSGGIRCTHVSYFEPGDEYCLVWPMLRALKDGDTDWAPRLSYRD